MDSARTQGHRLAPPPLTALAVLAGLAFCGGALLAMFFLAWYARQGQLGTTGIVVSLASVFGGAAVGCLLWGVAWLLRRQARLGVLSAHTFHPLSGLAGPSPIGPQPRAERAAIAAIAGSGGGDGGPPTAPLDWSEYDLLQQVAGQLAEINDNLLLTPEQREAKRKRRQERYSRELSEQIERAISDGQFSLAEQRLAELLDKVPDEPGWEAMRTRLAEARQAARGEDLQTCTRRVQDLMSVGSFGQAEELARELQRKYPDEPVAEELIQHVGRESEKFSSERRTRLFREVEQNAEGRRWRSAVEAAQQLIEAFPESGEAQRVRATLSTLQDNARIEEVREMRDYIRDLISRRRYSTALEVARDLIERFPDTVAAGELRQQLDRLAELSRASPPEFHVPS